MKRMKSSCLLAACLGLVACGDAATTSSGDGNTTGGQSGTTTTGGGNTTTYNIGDAVDLDGDGQKDDGVVVDDNGDLVADGVDTNGDGKSDQPLPTGGGSTGDVSGSTGDGASTGGTAGNTTTGGGSAGTDDAGDTLSCNGVGICDDNFIDTCDADPDTCPTTQASGIDVPDWDCSGTPPANVYAYATFPNGTTVAGANLAPGACVVFFEGAKDLYYAKWFKFGPKTVTADCSDYDGCICPLGAGNNWDRRLYAFTWDGDASCADIVLVDHGNASGGSNLEQAVSNDCRKYLYALHGDGDPSILVAPDGQKSFDLPFSYVAGSLPSLKLRLKDFPKIEVSCVEVMVAGVPKSQLMVSDVQTNPAYVAKK